MTTHKQIIAVPVPVSARNINTDQGTPSMLCYNIGNAKEQTMHVIPDGSKFIGCVSFDGDTHQFDFDPEPYVDFVENAIKIEDEPCTGYADYSSFNPQEEPAHIEYLQTAHESFISLLTSMEHFWINPLGEKPKEDCLILSDYI